jgi:uncharacterized protein YdaL
VTRRRRWFVAAALAAAVGLLLPGAARAADNGNGNNGNGQPAPAPAPTPAPPSALVLYDTTGPYGFLGEEYAIFVANLAGHFGTVKTEPVAAYKAGQIGASSATIYIGSTYDEPLPAAFLSDVAGATRPVVWMYDNIWEMTARVPDFGSVYGFSPWIFDFSAVAKVNYKGADLKRSSLNQSGIMSYSAFDATKATVLAQAVRPDGTTFPWAVRSGNLTYLGEIPFSYTDENDRSIIFSDLLFDALAPSTATRHRALVRIEDVGPDSDPDELRAIADYLSAQKVPFSFGVYPSFRDPNRIQAADGLPASLEMKDSPAVRDAIKYMITKGGTLIMHGWTHQYKNVANPYNGMSADDFEFFTAHVDANDYVIYDGPVPEDSQTWAAGRITSSFNAFKAAGLPAPTIFEFPHYAGSSADYQAVKARFTTRYERSLYYNGTLSGGTIDKTHYVGQYFPYPVTDVYGSKVLPENLGNVELYEVNHHPPRFPADIVASAKLNLVVRDGFASFFYHPYLGTSYLQQIVPQIKSLGYSFVSPAGL